MRVYEAVAGLRLLDGFSSTLLHPLPFDPLTLDKTEERIERKEKRSLSKVRCQKGGDFIARLLPVD